MEDKEGYGKKKEENGWQEEGINKDEGTKGQRTKNEGEGKQKVEEERAENDDWRNRERGKK